MNLTDHNVIRDLLNRHGFRFSKALGQNFLVNPSVCPRMAQLCGADETRAVLEIGPGFGVLTAELAKTAGKVVSVELDERLLPVLAETLADCENVEIVQGDILKLDLPALLQAHCAGMETVVCANLPYYITSPVIMALLEGKFGFRAITVMVQKEAAQRICAPVGSRASGAVTVAVDYYAKAEKLFDVSAGSFFPAPKVDSAVIRLDIREMPPVQLRDESLFFRMVRAAFGQRRKTAANAIAAGLGIQKDAVFAALDAAGLPQSVRAEALNMQQLADLANALAKIQQ